MGLSTLSTVHKHLENLKRKGYIRRTWNRSRSIEIVRFNRCPYCGHQKVGVMPENEIEVPTPEEARPIDQADGADGTAPAAEAATEDAKTE